MSETYADVFTYGGLKGRFASLDCANAGGGYDWDEFHVLRGVDGHLYVGSASGCSCNSFSDTDPITFQRVGSWQQAAAEALAWVGEESSYRDEQRETAAMNLIERLSRVRPEPHVEIDVRLPFGGAV